MPKEELNSFNVMIQFAYKFGIGIFTQDVAFLK